MSECPSAKKGCTRWSMRSFPTWYSITPWFYENHHVSWSSYFTSKASSCNMKDGNLLHSSYQNYGSESVYTQLKVIGNSWHDSASLKPEAAGWLSSMHCTGGLLPHHTSDRVYPSNICTQWHAEHLRHPARPPTLPQSVQLSQTLFYVTCVWSRMVSQVSQDILKESRNLWFSAEITH